MYPTVVRMMHCSCVESESGDNPREAETRRLSGKGRAGSGINFAANLRISPTKNVRGGPTLVFLSALRTETRY